MKDILIYPMGCSPACSFAVKTLQQNGIAVSDHPAPEVTHLLLDVPSFRDDGLLRCGDNIQNLLESLPENVTVIGGALDGDYRKLDLLKDPQYLADNAAITAQCAVSFAADKLDSVLTDCRVLVLGWGRIGKCLADILKRSGCRTAVMARKLCDRSMLHALGYIPISPDTLLSEAPNFRVIFNTVPFLLLPEESTANCTGLLIDLASVPGMRGSKVIQARGLPGRCAPESSGRLIAAATLRLMEERT